MNNPGRLLLYGSFAVLGVALAIGVAGSADSRLLRSEPPKQPFRDETVDSVGDTVDAMGDRFPAVEFPTGGLPLLPKMDRLATASSPPICKRLAGPPPLPALPPVEGPWVADPSPPLASQTVIAPITPAEEPPLPGQPLPAPGAPLAGANDPIRILPPPVESAAATARPLPPVLPPPPTSEVRFGGSQPPAPAVAPASAAAVPIVRTTIKDEGDDRLSITIRDEDIRKVLEGLSEMGDLNILASTNVQGKVSATLYDVDVETALRAILQSTGYTFRRQQQFLYVGTPEDFEKMDRLADRITVRIYRPNYIRAADLEELIQPLLTAEIGSVAVTTPAEMGIDSNAFSAGGDGFAGSDAIVVRDYEAVLYQIDQLIEELDVRPLQVHIEAMILSVKLDDENKFGVNFELLRDQANVRLGWGTPPASLANLEFDDGGLKFGFLDSSLGMFLEALEKVGDTNVIATPRLMALNKHRAEILIGEEIGYKEETQTETSSTETTKFLETGAILRLRPFISSDGLIRMEVHPELSDGAINEVTGVPDKQTTQVTTNLLVKDGCTVVIGGLMREQLTSDSTQVPVLGSLPLVGPAFRSKSETLERREILVLITPRIVYEPNTCHEGDKAACEFHRRREVLFDHMSPAGKRSIAARYFRLAQNAWDAGNRRAALRFADLAIHFNPIDRAAIDLRSDILQGNHSGDHTLAGERAAALAPPSIDGQAITPWLLDELGKPKPRPPAPLHPHDPGQPGRRRDIVEQRNQVGQGNQP